MLLSVDQLTVEAFLLSCDSQALLVENLGQADDRFRGEWVSWARCRLAEDGQVETIPADVALDGVRTSPDEGRNHLSLQPAIHS